MKYFREKGKIFGFFWTKYRNLVRKIEVKSLESNYNVLVRKKFFPKKLSTGRGGGRLLSEKCFSGKIFEIGTLKKIASRRPCLSIAQFDALVVQSELEDLK